MHAPAVRRNLLLLALAAAGCSKPEPMMSTTAIEGGSGGASGVMAPPASGGTGEAGTTSTAPTGGKPSETTTDAGTTSQDPGAAGTSAAGSGGMDAPEQAGTGGTVGEQAGAAGAAGMAGAPNMDKPNCSIGSDDGTPQPAPLSLSGNTFAHDPTMIEVDGTFYRFWTGDNIPSATSTDLMRWSNAPAVYRGGYPAWSREWLATVPDQTFNFPWAPDVSQFGGKFHLYSSFSARFGANISCITHLTTTDIAAGDWTDHGPVICSERSDRYNAIDADVGFDEEGAAWFSFGSFWDGIMLFPLDETGARKGDEPPTRIAWAPEIEAPVLFRRCEYFYLFVSHGTCCPGAQRPVGSLSYRVVVGRADNIRGPYIDKEGRPLTEEGGTLVVAGDRSTFAAAGHSDILVADDRIYHLYHAYRLPRGDAELRIVELRFDADGWPIPHDP